MALLGIGLGDLVHTIKGRKTAISMYENAKRAQTAAILKFKQNATTMDKMLATVTRSIGRTGRDILFWIRRVYFKSNTVLGIVMKTSYAWARGGWMTPAGMFQATEEVVLDMTGVVVANVLGKSLVQWPYPHLPDSGLIKRDIVKVLNIEKPKFWDTFQTILLFKEVKGKRSVDELYAEVANIKDKFYDGPFNVNSENDLVASSVIVPWFLIKTWMMASRRGVSYGSMFFDEMIMLTGAYAIYSLFMQLLRVIEEDIPVIGGVVSFLLDDFIDNATGEIHFI